MKETTLRQESARKRWARTDVAQRRAATEAARRARREKRDREEREAFAEAVREVVAAAPPLTPKQKAALRRIFAGTNAKRAAQVHEGTGTGP